MALPGDKGTTIDVHHAGHHHRRAPGGGLAVGFTMIGVLAFGRRWRPAWLLLAAAVLLILLLAPDPYAAFGLVFWLTVVLGLVDVVLHMGIPQRCPGLEVTMLSEWVLVALLGLQAHVAASYLVPLKKEDQGDFGDLLRWFWSWADGDGGLPGKGFEFDRGSIV